MSCKKPIASDAADLGKDSSTPSAKKAKLEEEDEAEFQESELVDAEEDVEQEEEIEDGSKNAKHEESLGIIERVSKTNKRFHAVLKHIPADFIVNEINLDNQVVYLSDLSEPRAPLEQQPVVEAGSESREEFDVFMRKVIGEAKFQELTGFLSANSSSSSFRIEAPKDKLERKKVHDFFKLFYKAFNSNTINEVNKENKQTQQIIEICHNKFNRDSMKDCFRPSGNSEAAQLLNRFKIIECALYKENIDTIQAVNLIAKHLRISSKRIGIAGTKDKRAITTQMISMFKIDPKKILSLNDQFNNIKLGNLKLSKEGGFKLGDLSGNRFKLTLRNVDEANDDLIREQIDAFKSNGFINYFGLQRFGNSVEVPTHSIGRCLIQNQIKEAIELILKPRSDTSERDDVKRARETWFNNKEDAMKAFVQIQRVNCIEKFLLNGLANSNKNDYLGALQYIPRNMRTMYLHAYQSYIWNMAVSKRIQLYGLKPQIGDLVRNKVEQKRLKNQKFNASRKPGSKAGEEAQPEAIYVTESNIGDFSIEDVVLPLPGYDVLYPKNDIKAYYEEILAKDGLDLSSFKNKIKDFSLSGDYRNIVTKPGNVNYSIVRYQSNEKPLTKTDWELLKTQAEEPAVQSDGDKKALIIEFNLPSSAYATVALRELLLG